MTHVLYPAIVFPTDPETGLVGITIPGININTCGQTTEDAVQDATAILQEVLDDLSAADESPPDPFTLEATLALDGGDGGSVVYIQAVLPGRNVRVNVMLPEGLVKRIDAIAPNRSSFLAEGALHKLRQG